MANDPQEDRAAVGHALAGDRRGFDALVDRHGGALLGYLKSRTRDSDRAQELFQEAWVRAFAELEDLQDPQRFRSWLFSIALNELRRGTRRAATAGLEDAPLDRARGPVGLAEDEEARRAVAGAIEDLPERQRECFRLRAIGELAHAEIAEILGISAEAARANHHQAVRRLRERLSRFQESPTSKKTANES